MIQNHRLHHHYDDDDGHHHHAKDDSSMLAELGLGIRVFDKHPFPGANKVPSFSHHHHHVHHEDMLFYVKSPFPSLTTSS